tara:strand:+ start:307 stop:687 length:381 start_codon:yes stop_codon:yes gene_type:complete
MKFVDFNFVSDEQAKKIMESYGYTTETPEVIEVTPEEIPVIEESQVELPDYVCVVDGKVYGLVEGITEVEEDLYIEVQELPSTLEESLEDSETQVLESVEIEDVSYVLGDLYENQETGKDYIKLGK